MTTQEENKRTAKENNLLTLEEQAVCQKIISLDSPHSQHALALLNLNESMTQSQAADQAGLTIGQLRYWLTKFRKQRLGIFPVDLLEKLGTEDKQVEETVVPVMVAEPEPVAEKTKPIKGKKKKTKGKKGKKAKKKKKKPKKKKGKKNKKKN